MVAVWFLAYDLMRDRPLWTPSLLGAALFDGWSQVAPVEPSARLVAKYTIVHGIAFIVFGCALAGLFAIADRDFRFLFAIFMLLGVLLPRHRSALRRYARTGLAEPA